MARFWRIVALVGHHMENGGLCLIFCPHKDWQKWVDKMKDSEQS